MKKQKRVLLHALVAFIFAAGVMTTASQTVRADDPEFDAIAKHLKLHYNAKRIHIPFLGLANFFVKIIKPAGVKSFKVAVFQDLNFTTSSNDTELGQVMRNALSADWQPVVRARERDGEQVYIYAKADGDNIKLMVVTLDHSDAVVARVKVSPEKLSEFMNNPKILGISVR
ncbi:MAG TPA: hypothetical protein VF779_00810 [Pyrinomonadaceae bacterium]